MCVCVCTVHTPLADDSFSGDCPYQRRTVTTLTAPNAAIAVQRVQVHFASYLCARAVRFGLDTASPLVDLHDTVSAAREAATGYTQNIVLRPRASTGTGGCAA